MSLSKKLIFLMLLTSISRAGYAAGKEETRLRGFAEHQNENEQFDKARQRGERAFYEELDQWEAQRHRQLDDYKKTKKEKEMTDDGPEFRADAAAKKEVAKDYEKTRKAYSLEKANEEKLSREDKKLPTEAQELGLDSERPRYDYRKRAAFGAKPKFGSNAGSSSGSSPSFGGGNFPPPPTFDDFSGGGGGYVPAPNLPEDFGDVPPPPPPPPPPGFGGDDAFPNDFSAPPPPPPFGEEGEF